MDGNEIIVNNLVMHTPEDEPWKVAMRNGDKLEAIAIIRNDSGRKTPIGLADIACRKYAQMLKDGSIGIQTITIHDDCQLLIQQAIDGTHKVTIVKQKTIYVDTHDLWQTIANITKDNIIGSPTA